jgi:glycosyltransferase involved in cell wall biosynthesis
MRIAAISNSRIPSLTANSIQAMKVCDALAQAGHDIRMIVPAEACPTPWSDLARHYGVSHPFQIEWRPSVRLLKRLDFTLFAQAAANRFKADLIYTWLPQSAVLATRLHVPVILEMHADVAGRLGAWWLRQFWKGSAKRRLLVTTRALLGALERSSRMKFPKPAVQVAPNGVDLERYASLPAAEEARRTLHLKDGFTAGFTGHFYAGRGNSLLFEMARALPTMNFVWVGGTPQAVQEWRSKLAAARRTNVTLTGFVDNSRLALYQAAADILLMPYGSSVAASSGQDIAEVINPMKMFEYMAAARAIVTSDLPVIREILDETSAVFCPVGDVAAWKSAIEELSSDENRRKKLGLNARRKVESHTWAERARTALQDMP